MIGNENLGIKINKEEKSYRKYSANSDTTEKTCDESINKSMQKNERHVTFHKNFLNIIDVESWRKFNIDVTEKDPNWHKVESQPEEKNIENILNKKITPVSENLSNNNEHLKLKKEKLSCQCTVF